MNQENTLFIIKIVSTLLAGSFIIYSIVRAGGLGAVLKNSVNLVNGAENAWLNFAAAVIPYGVSLIPATLTYQHVRTELHFEFWTAVDAGIVVELFGVVAMQTIIRFWQNNKKYTSNKSENRAPLGLAIFAYSFYLIIVLVVNVVLEIIAGKQTFWGILAIGLFSLLGIPSGILVAIRSQHREVLEEKRAMKQQPKQEQSQQREQKVKHASGYANQIIAMLEAEYEKNKRVMAPKEITAKLKLDHNKSKGYVSTLTSKWVAEKGIDKKAGSDKFTF
jgi:hypothetical protein